MSFTTFSASDTSLGILRRHYYGTACLLLLVPWPVTPAVADEPLETPTRSALQEQARRCRKFLKSSIIHFYLPACVDRTNGGYLESHRGDRFAATGEKFLTLQARQLWFFSTVATAGIEKEAAVAAKCGFDFLEGKFRDRKHGGYFAKVSDDGRPADRRKHVYLNAFALYALAAYRQARGDAVALTAAKDLFQTLESKAHDARRGGYTEFFREDWSEITDPREPSFIGPPGTKTFITRLHVLEALAELYRVWPDPLVRRRLEESLVINTLTVRLPRHGCNVDGFTPDWRPIETPRNLRASYGHDVEGAWLCLDAARALGHSPGTLRGWAEGPVGYSLKHGYDRGHGGFYYAGPLGKDADDTKKGWWAQAEALVSMLEMFKLTGRKSTTTPSPAPWTSSRSTRSRRRAAGGPREKPTAPPPELPARRCGRGPTTTAGRCFSVPTRSRRCSQRNTAGTWEPRARGRVSPGPRRGWHSPGRSTSASASAPTTRM
jgi:mannobiose 2-epimerase